MIEPEGRGQRYLKFARALDQPGAVLAQARPAPRPPVELRPKALSVTRIETLRRDPYAIYAETILRLQGARGGRTRHWAARNGNGVARRAAGVCRGLSVRRPACRMRANVSSSLRERALRCCATIRLSRASLAEHRKGPRLLSRFRARNARRDRRKSGSSGRARSPCRSQAERRSSSARGRTGSTSCNRAARGSSTTRAERRRRPRTSRPAFRRS